MSQTARTSCGPSIVTYRWNNQLVYVKPTDTYEEAIECARKEFPQLSGVDPELISLEVKVSVRGDRTETRKVRIGASAWNGLTFSLAQYEIIDIVVMPPGPRVIVQDFDDAPPNYPSELDSKEYNEFLHSGSPSRKRSPSNSRSTTPKGSPKLADRMLGWMETKVSKLT
ncbi:hypothetical protein EW026_g5512 [Hermanssonia centrifuga]|uniref:Uncharacterized protein n=1 Tax=Hermanssonia centrifuga TaxID=98765 RepID=A0A4S4KFN7_9APHY|nr:hypothetical protein EW026_g5512 [Hermanssonia centrifuga]